MAGFTYKSYSFTDKDPIIDEVATAIRDCGVNYKWIEQESGVTAATLYGWFYGKTKKPQAATINAVVRALGYKLALIQYRAITHIEPPLSQTQPKAASVRHVVQMAKYKRKAK
jgi:signal recognition particle subunit SEC65